MSDYDADVQHLAEYYLGDPPYRAATPEEQARRVQSLARALQATIDAWIWLHPVNGARRQRWRRVQDGDA